jgi:hypothetical protein
MASDIGIPIIYNRYYSTKKKIRKSLLSSRPIPKANEKNAAMSD